MRAVLLRTTPLERLLVILPLIVLLWSTVCIASDFEDGMVAARRGDYKTAAALYTRAASKGETGAQSALGLLYHEGIGVPQDYSQAALWFRKAADNGDSLGQFFLGQMYRNGQGLPQDYKQAELWFRKSADQGNPLAYPSLGEMYEKGQGIPQNYVEAYKWYNLAAQNLSDEEIRGVGDNFIKARDRAAAKIKEARIQARQSQKPNIKVCVDGPQHLRQVDDWEQKNYVADVRPLGFDTPEQLAESYIGDCSYVIGVLPLASMDKGIINFMQSNLDYMKWWLQNRREKKN